MGSKLEVWAWRRTKPATEASSGYEDVLVYRGESWWRAIAAAIKAKRTCGRVRVMWR